MNNTFNIQRFGLLLKRQWLEFGKIYLVSLVVLWGVFLCFYGYSYYEMHLYRQWVPGDYAYRLLNFRVPLFVVTGLIFGTLISSSYFSHFGQKPKAIIDLLIPASTFEKFLAGVFFTSVVATVSFLALFYLTDAVFVMKTRDFVENATKTKLVSDNQLNYFFNEYNPNEFKPLYLVPFFITSIFLAGSIYFNRFHYIKTAISVMIFSGIWTAIVFKLGEALFKGKILIERNEMGSNNMTKSTGELLGILLLLVLTLIFWSITYVRLKEKEV